MKLLAVLRSLHGTVVKDASVFLLLSEAIVACNGSPVHCTAYQYHIGYSITTTAEVWAGKNPINPTGNAVIETMEIVKLQIRDLTNKHPLESR